MGAGGSSVVTNLGSAGTGAATGATTCSGAAALIWGVVSRAAAGASPAGLTSITFEHTEQRARAPPVGTFAGSTR